MVISWNRHISITTDFCFHLNAKRSYISVMSILICNCLTILYFYNFILAYYWYKYLNLCKSSSKQKCGILYLILVDQSISLSFTKKLSKRSFVNFFLLFNTFQKWFRYFNFNIITFTIAMEHPIILVLIEKWTLKNNIKTYEIIYKLRK